MPYIDFRQLEELEATANRGTRTSWRSVGKSDIGHTRKVNEDAFFNSTEQGLWAVADGMGGLARGDFASGVVVDALVYCSRLETLASSIRHLELKLREAHDNCRNAFHGERVGSTVAALFSYGSYAFFLWAGDTRVYRLRDGQLSQLTCDHTLGQEKVARGELTPAKAKLHPSSHVLTRAVGVHQTLHLELDYDAIQSGDRYLICSDGLYNPLQFDTIETLLQKDTIEKALENLVQEALRCGGQDNITGVLVELVEIESTDS